ncbi:MAG: ABC transporter ATP-binding protein, partial [Alphaproteobacteria bacterium]
YFQNDFAGRIANKVFDTGSAMRDIVIILTGSLWWVAVSITISGISLATSSFWLLTPLAAWLVLYAVILRHHIPRIRKRSMEFSDTRSLSMGRTVDAYTNIQTVKLFASGDREDTSLVKSLITAREAHVAMHTTIFRMKSWSDLNNTIFMGTTLALALWLWTNGLITAGSVAMVIPIAVMLTNQAGWIAGELTTFFEQLGTAEETMQVLVKPHTLTDADHAKPLVVNKGEIGFNDITFRYHPEAAPVIEGLNLTIAPGQKVGLIGHSGAGKSTLVNLLLRFYELADGTITIDQQNIAGVTQNSLRSHIGMVTQDTSLLHRSIRANIAYGSPDATDDQIIAAAKMAHAHEFILELSDKDGNTGYASKVGERGVKLSGGQRQRIAIARLILKNAPILIMDEATSALDSEVEHAIQENLTTLMQGKTVIAIAHRLSTISQLDRLLVLENGQIVEDGTHQQLIRKGGAYAKLWSRQSGGFLPE